MKILHAGTLVLLVTVRAAESGVRYSSPCQSGVVDNNTRELFQESMDLDAQLYDRREVGSSPQITKSSHRAAGSYMVRESSWYALGLLLRDEHGRPAACRRDTGCSAEAAIPHSRSEVVRNLSRTPGGTRSHAETTRHLARLRPNWRHFIGTTLAMILIEFPDRISPEFPSACTKLSTTRLKER